MGGNVSSTEGQVQRLARRALPAQYPRRRRKMRRGDSTFAWQTFNLAEEGEWARAFANLLLTTVLGFAAIWIGYRLGARWFAT